MSHCSLHRSLSPCALARLVAEARRWLAFATERGLPTRYAAEKALGALALSARLALPIHSACSVSVRSARPDANTGDEEACAHGVALAVPTKLVGTSAFQPALRALRVTGDPARGHTLGVNVAFTGLGDAIRAFERATVERATDDGAIAAGAEKRTGNAVAAMGPTARRDPHPAA